MRCLGGGILWRMWFGSTVYKGKGIKENSHRITIIFSVTASLVFLTLGCFREKSITIGHIQIQTMTPVETGALEM